MVVFVVLLCMFSGELQRVLWCLDVLVDWNGDLVMLVYGYELVGVLCVMLMVVNDGIVLLLVVGYVVVQSVYGSQGWVVVDVIIDMECLCWYVVVEFKYVCYVWMLGFLMGGVVIFVSFEWFL